MKYTGRITASQIANLTAAKARLEKHLRHASGAEKKIAAHTERLAALAVEHAELQETAHSGTNRQAFIDLQACHAQRRTFAAHIETAHAEAADCGGALREAVDSAASIVCEVMGKDLQEQLTEAVGAANAPFWHRESDARNCIRSTDAIRELGHFLNPPLPSDVPALAWLGRRLVKTITAVLDGGELWDFIARANWADGMPGGEA